MVLADLQQPHGLRTKILDFGIAKVASGPDGKVRTETGAMIGTPAYMSPEQCVGAGAVDGKADVYALGVMLYEMLAYRLPFECEHSFDFMAAHVRDEPQPLHDVLPDVPQEIEALVHSMLAKKPADRPSMEAVAAMLEQVQALASEMWLRPPPDTEPADPANLAFDATVSGPGKTPLRSGKLSDGARASGPRRSKESIELGETFPGAKNIQRRVSREAIVPVTPLPNGAPPIASQSRESLPPPSAASHQPIQRPNRSRFIAIFAGLLAVVLLVIAVARRDAATTSGAVGRTEAVRPAAAVRMVHWNVISTPPGAEVRSEGKLLGRTPWDVERPAGSGETALTLSFDGYQDKTIVLSHSTEVTTEVRLIPRVAPASTASATPVDAGLGDATKPALRKPAKSKSVNGKGHKSRSQDDEVKLLID